MVDKKNSKSQTSLHLACQKCNLDCVRLLVKKGADTNSKDDKGNTPLHLAVLAAPKENELMLMALLGQSSKKKEDQSIQITRFLLQNGADITIQNNDGVTPLDFCKSDRIKSAVERLIRDSSKYESKVPEVPSITKVSNAPDKCARCLEKEPDILFVPCGHRVVCRSCCNNLHLCQQCSLPIKKMFDTDWEDVKDAKKV